MTWPDGISVLFWSVQLKEIVEIQPTLLLILQKKMNNLGNLKDFLEF